MDWVNAIEKAIQYIENHLVEDITVKDVARYIHISEFYFQKGFAMLCGFTISEYIRKRRLSLAGNEIAGSDIKIIDILCSSETNNSFRRRISYGLQD